MRVELTPEQAEQLGPLFETVRNADGIGLTGMLVAQVLQNHRTKQAWMRVGFVKHHQALRLVQQATEQVGKSET